MTLLLRWTMTSWAMLAAMTTFAQDWDHRHAFAKSYWGVSLHGVPSMGEGLLNAEENPPKSSTAARLSRPR